jgi:hypothetical protein
MQKRTTGNKQQRGLAAKKKARFPQKQLNIWKTPERKWRCMDMRMQRYLPSQGTKCFTHLLFKIIYCMSLPDLLGSLQKMKQTASIALYVTKEHNRYPRSSTQLKRHIKSCVPVWKYGKA